MEAVAENGDGDQSGVFSVYRPIVTDLSKGFRGNNDLI